MTASEARAKSESAQNKKHQQQMAQVLSDISKASALGKYHVHVYQELEDSVKKVLHENGYMVHYIPGGPDQRDQPYFSVEW